MIVKLNSGSLQGASLSSGENSKFLDKKCMLVYEGDFESMDGPVSIKGEHIEALCSNYNKRMGEAKLASGEPDMKQCAPIQLDHSTSATMTVGRLIGPLEVGEYEGKKALMGKLRVLGAENVEKVADGRWTHLSIGADLEEGTISELTITPFPAAANAVMLAKGTKTSEGENMNKEKLKKYLMDHKKMSEKEADEHLSKMGADDSEEMKKLSSEVDEHEKKLAAEADPTKMGGEADPTKMSGEADPTKMTSESDEEIKKKAQDIAKHEEEEKKEKEMKKAKMSADVKTKFIALHKSIKTSNAKVQLEAKKAKIGARLSALRKEGKLSPAELKGISIDEISKLDDSASEVLFGTLSKLSKKLDTSVSGTTKAETIEKVRSKYNLARLELETRLNMPMKRAEALVQLKKLKEDEDKEIKAAEGAPEHKAEMSSSDEDFKHLSKLMDEGKIDDAKKALKSLMDKMGKSHLAHDEAAAGDEKRMSALATDVQKLHNEYKELVTLVTGELGFTSEELE